MKMEFMKNLKRRLDERLMKKLRLSVMRESEEALALKACETQWKKVRGPRALKIIIPLSLMGTLIQWGTMLTANAIKDYIIGIGVLFVLIMGIVFWINAFITEKYEFEVGDYHGQWMREHGQLLIFLGVFIGLILLIIMEISTVWDLCQRTLVVNLSWFGIMGWYGWQEGRYDCHYGFQATHRQREMKVQVHQPDSALYQEIHPKAVALFEQKMFDRIAKRALKEKRDEIKDDPTESLEMKDESLTQNQASVIKAKTVRRL